ncbi:MAG: hypothetical protein WAL75_26350 [Terracidiphilus sp.]
MSKARVSIIVYGAYLATAGLVLALIPNVLMALVGLPDDRGFWVRIAGALAFVLGIKGIYNSTAENVAFFRFDSFTRTFAATFMVILVLSGIAPKIILVLAAIDYGGALWTVLAIQADKRSAVRTVAA